MYIISKTYWSACNYFIPTSLKSNHDEYRGAHFAIAMALIYISVSPMYAILYFLVGLNYIGVILLFGSLVGLTAAYTIKITGNIHSTSHQFGVSLLLMIGSSVLVTGGLDSTALSWLCIAPLGGMLISGIRPAILWTIITTSLIIILFVANLLGHTFISQVPTQYLVYFYFLTSVGFAPVIVWMCYAFEFCKTDALNKLSYSEKELSKVRKESALNSMAFSVAHEVNSPLSTIHLSSNRCIKLLEAESINEELIKEKLIIINSVTERIFNLTKGLGYFSQTHSQTKDEKVMTTIGAVMDTAIKTSRRMVICQKTELNFIMIDELYNEPFECLYGPFLSAIQNLVEESAHCTIGTDHSKVDVYVTKNNQQLIICIGDSGGAIPIAVTRFLENPFEESTKLRAGLGLRLGIAVNLINMHNGSIISGTDSNKERFILRVPIKMSQEIV